MGLGLQRRWVVLDSLGSKYLLSLKSSMYFPGVMILEPFLLPYQVFPCGRMPKLAREYCGLPLKWIIENFDWVLRIFPVGPT